MEQFLSPHQERLWFIDHFERGYVYPHPPTYHNLPLVLAGRGALDVDTAQSVLAELIIQHEVLRTQLQEGHLPARPTIVDETEVPVVATELPEGSTEPIVEAHLIKANAAPFILNEQPLLRSELVRVASEGDAGRFWWLITLHHLIADRASMMQLADEIAAKLRGDSVPPPEIHYADYVDWQRNLPADALEPLLFYWKWQLRGRLPPLELPTARPRMAVHSFTADRHTFSWGPSLTHSLRDLARNHDTTPTFVALAVFKVLLHRYAQQPEIIIGTSVANRRQEGTASLIGPVANLLVLRSTFEDHLSVADVLAQFAQTYSEALAHQEMPFDPLVQTLNPAKDMSRTALFDILATVAESPLPAWDGGPSGELRLVDFNLGYGKYDLALHLQFTRDDTVNGTLTFNTDLHDHTFVAQLACHFTRLLETAATHPTVRIADLPLLTAAEETQQLHTFNDTAAEAPRDDTLAARFTRQVEAHPDRIALSGTGDDLTYRELDHRANQLAHQLIGQNVSPDTLVAVALPRSTELVVTLLAVLKSGGAYLPLEPTHPAERIQFTLEDACVTHLITRSGILQTDELPPSVQSLTLLDRDATAIAAQAGNPPSVATGPENLAYCIYTSGSTGRPKGALIEHRQVVRLMETSHSPFDFGPTDVWSCFHSACFDFSVWEMYGALLFGGRLVMVDTETAQDPDLFADLVIEQGITILNQTPSSFRQVDAALARKGYPAIAVRQVIFGGEALAPLYLRDFNQAYPAAELINMYGITETTVHVTYHLVTADDIAQNRPIIGRPLPTTTTLVLDRNRRLLPLGVAGEICVGGEGLARGYLNRRDLTQEKFIGHPYQSGARLYCSGDRGAVQPDGTLLHLGRTDDQVQVRGFRVELGEIRTCLLQHPAVSAAEVTARPQADLSIMLTAYLVCHDKIDTTMLRQHVAETLPNYMIPGAFVLLDTLPLTPNGKVDRDALPDPTESLRPTGPDFSAPANEIETFVAQTFVALLSAPQVGRDHHFFELGGHSLLAAQLVSRIRAEYQIELPLKHVFTSPTVAALAAVIDQYRAETQLTPEQTVIPRAARRSAATIASSDQP